VHAAKESAGCAVCLRSDAAGVGHDHIGPGGVKSWAQAKMAQLGAYDLAVSPASTASKVLNVVFCHVVSLKRFHSYCARIKIARCGFRWGKTTTMFLARSTPIVNPLGINRWTPFKRSRFQVGSDQANISTFWTYGY
jgi:hypothetical protein